jgi:hypothetical protein
MALLVAGCGGTKTVTETLTTTTGPVGTTTSTTSTGTSTSGTVPAGTTGNFGPHFFETPSHNIGCDLTAQSVRCDIRERTWSPPPEPPYCKKAGVDFGQGIAVGMRRAAFVCAGDTTLGAKAILPYGASAQRGSLICVSHPTGLDCQNTGTGHGFSLSRTDYRLF